MRLFKIGEISKKLIYPILMSIANMFTIISTILLNIEYKDDKGNVIEFGKHPLVNDFIMFLAEGSVIFIFCLQQKLMKDNDTQDTTVENLTKSQIIYKKEEQKRKAITFLPDNKKIKSFLLILGTFTIDLVASTALFIIRQIDNVSSIELLFKIVCLISSTFLSICLLNYKYYKHHFIGCFILCIGLISYSVIDVLQNLPGIKEKEDEKSKVTKIIIMIILLLSYVFTSLQEVAHKYLMDFMYVSPFAIISLEGIIGILFMSGTLFFLNFKVCTSDLICTPGKKVEDVFDTFNNVIRHYQLFIPIIILFFSFAFFNCFRLLTNQAYSPTHRIIPDVFGCFFSWLIRVIFPSLDDISYFMDFQILIIAFSFFVMMIGALIYLELIELHFCGLSRNTRRTIALRQDIDLKINLNIKRDPYPLLDQSVD